MSPAAVFGEYFDRGASLHHKAAGNKQKDAVTCFHTDRRRPEWDPQVAYDSEYNGTGRVLFRTGKCWLHPNSGQMSFWKLVLEWLMLSWAAPEAEQMVSLISSESGTLSVTWSRRNTGMPSR